MRRLVFEQASVQVLHVDVFVQLNQQYCSSNGVVVLMVDVVYTGSQSDGFNLELELIDAILYQGLIDPKGGEGL